MTLEISISEYETIRKGLMELPAKDSYILIAKLDAQIVEQNQDKKQPSMAGAKE